MTCHLFLKQVVVSCCLFLAGSSVAAQEYTSYVQGKKKSYTLATDRIFVEYRGDGALSRRGKAPGIPSATAIKPQSLTSHPGAAFLEMKAGSTRQDIEQAIVQLKAEADVVGASPVLLDATGEPVGALTNQIVIGLKEGTSLANVEKLIRQFQATDLRPVELVSRCYTLVVKKQSNVLLVANSLYETGLFTYAEPNFVVFVKKNWFNDPLLSQQWSLENSGYNSTPYGTNDADIDAEEAWNIPNACNGSNMRVAILDEGVDLNHIDLRGNLEPGFDATGNGSAGGATGTDSHGTACAGIVAAVANNNEGIAGVAHKAHIVPVRLYQNGGSIYDLQVATAMATGIGWAWRNNRADVLSMSWYTRVGQGPIEQAINDALALGRNTRGCVVVASTGNFNASTIEFPSSVPGVIAVGASNMCDSRMTPQYCGNNYVPWGSNYGTGLDIMAPGIDIPTLNLGGGYIMDFNGTSAAAPHVAAVAALVLSMNPTLSQTEARRILETTTDGMGYGYLPNVAGQPNGPWNDHVGYGRVNAAKAVRAVAGRLVNPSANFCSTSSVQLSIQNLPAGASVTWDSSDPYLATVSASGQVTRVGNYAGTVTITASVIFNTPCGQVTIPLITTIEAGPNPITGGTFSPNEYGQTQTLVGDYDGTNYTNNNQVSLNFPYENGTTYSFAVDDPNASISGYQNTATLRFNPYSNYSYVTVTVTKTNSCGSRSANFIFNYSGYYFTYSPNPASEELTVTIHTSNEQKTHGEKEFEVQLFDNYGKQVKAGQSTGGQVKLDVRDLPPGLYNLRAGEGKQAIRKHIQITH